MVFKTPTKYRACLYIASYMKTEYSFGGCAKTLSDKAILRLHKASTLLVRA